MTLHMKCNDKYISLSLSLSLSDISEIFHDERSCFKFMYTLLWNNDWMPYLFALQSLRMSYINISR